MSFKEAKEKVMEFKHRNEARLEAQHDELLHSSKPDIRARAISAMMKYEQSSAEIEKLLKDHNPKVRQMAIRYYFKHSDTKDHELIEPLLDDLVDIVVIEAIYTCFWLSKDDDEARFLLRFLDHKSPSIRLATLKTASEYIDSEQMIDLTKDPDKKVAEMANMILVKRSSDKNDLMKIVEGEYKMDLKKIALDKLRLNQPKYAKEWLESLINSPEYSATQRTKLVSLIDDYPLEISEGIINNQVERVKDEAIVPRVILRYVKNNKDAPNRVFTTLRGYLEHKNPAMRVAAIKGFSKLNEASGSLEVREYIFDPDEKVRAAAVNALAKMLDFHLAEHIPELIKDHSWHVRIAVVKAVGRMKIEDFYDLVVDIVCKKREDERVWKEAIKVAAKLKLGEVVYSLQEVMKDDHEEFSILNNTADALLSISPEAVLEILDTPQEKTA